MISTNLKSGIRFLWSNKSISFINILGLSLGLSAFVIILLWVENEFSYNAHQKNASNISAVMTNQSFESGEIQTYPATPPPLAKKLMESVKGIKSATTTSWGDQVQFEVNENKNTEYGLYASPEIIDVFDISFVAGDKANALKKPNSLVISKKLAEKYFKNSDPIGQSIKIAGSQNYEVVGVIQDVDKKSTFRYDFLMPLTDYFSFNPFMMTDWSANNVRTYIKYDQYASTKQIESSIKNLLHQHGEKHQKSELFLFNMKDWYLRGEFKDGKMIGGRIKYVYIFSIVAFVILLLSCINFINLTTAGSTNRLKEIGVKKTLGADKWALVNQFLKESVFMAMLAGILAIGLINLILPFFNAEFYLDLQLGFNTWTRPLFFIGIVFITGLLGGIYPAFVLSGLGSIDALKKNIFNNSASTTMIRKTLVTSQFAITIILVTGALIVIKQIQFFETKDLGIDQNNLVWFPSQIPADKVDVALSEFKNIPGVSHAATTSMTFQGSNNRGSEVSWPGKKQGDDVFFNFIACSHDLPTAMGFKILDGRTFSKESVSDTSAVLINETAVKQMNLKEPIGQTIETRNGKSTIVGVVKDFHFESLHNTIGPLIVQCRPDWTWAMYVKMDGSNNASALQAIESTYKKFAPDQLFEYNNQSDKPGWFYRSEGQTATLIKWFSAFAVFLSCLGLLGLTIFRIEKMKKEIGVRKVLGAKFYHLMILLSKQFIFLIFIAIVVAFIPSYYLTNQWLETFAYSVQPPWYLYALGPVVALLFAMITISLLIFKASTTNPVTALRSE